jgi:uncharacterized membrane protein YgcG
LKRLLLLAIAGLVILAVPAYADPGPSDEVVIQFGTCDDGLTVVSAHNTQDMELGYLIRIDGQIVEEGRLAPGERVERTYEVKLGESHFFRIRLGLTGDGAYFSTEGTTDRTHCPSESPSPSPSTSPPPTSSSPPPTSTSSTSSQGGSHSGTSSPTTSVRGESGSRSAGGTSGTAFTGSDHVPWLIAWTLGLLIVGTSALRISSRRKDGN